jgi:hypothetical protein
MGPGLRRGDGISRSYFSVTPAKAGVHAEAGRLPDGL